MSTASAISTPDEAAQPRASQADPPRRLYVYCVIDCDERADFGPIGMGDDHPHVFAVAHEGVAALVGAAPCGKVQLSRGNLLCHQRVMEAAMARGHTVLPVRFSTIAEAESDRSAERRIVDRILVRRAGELRSLLGAMSARVELGVKGIWTDMAAVFSDLAGANEEIAALRQRLLAASRSASRVKAANVMARQVELGRLVQGALKEAKLAAETELAGRMAPWTVELKKNKTFGDSMFANLAILADSSRQADISDALSAFEAEWAGRVRLRSIGPVPPANFVELVITWDD